MRETRGRLRGLAAVRNSISVGRRFRAWWARELILEPWRWRRRGRHYRGITISITPWTRLTMCCGGRRRAAVFRQRIAAPTVMETALLIQMITRFGVRTLVIRRREAGARVRH